MAPCELPAIGLHATAASVARFYGGLVEPTGPVAALLGRGLPSAFRSPTVVWHDRLLERDVAWTPEMQADECGLGMGGIGGCDAYADTRHGFGYAHLTRRLGDHSRSESDPRCSRVGAAVKLTGAGADEVRSAGRLA